MIRWLDEGKLQSYFDGELSIDMMESVTSHLASCVTCAAAAREMEEETAFVMSALSAEFEASVPTERLRERINEAVLGDRIAIAQSTQKAGFFSGLLNFGTQRTLGYASLAIILAFAAIAVVVKMRTTPPTVNKTNVQADNKQAKTNNDQVAEVAPKSEPGNIQKASVPVRETPKNFAPRPVKVIPVSTAAAKPAPPDRKSTR